MGIRYVILAAIICLCGAVSARPVSYAGGYTVMGRSDSLKDSLYTHYSPSHRYSVGLEFVDDKVLDTNYFYLRYTRLLVRKNSAVYQGNVYFQSGLSDDGPDNYFYGVHGDWETRKLFAGFGYKRTETDTVDYDEKYIHAGFAPYVGDYGDLHTWLMFRLKQDSINDEWQVLPVVKFFKHDALVEIGYNDKSGLDIHLMYRF